METDDGDPATEIIETVLHRRDLLERLLEAPKTKRALDDELAVSRSTIDRAVRELEMLDLVTYSGDGYAVTPIGELFTRRCIECLEAVDVALRVEDVLRWIPPDDLDVDVRQFADARVVTPEPGDPYAMINRHVEVLEDAAVSRCLLPAIGLQGHQAAHENVVHGDAESELVVSADVATTLLEDPRYAPLTEDLLATDRFELYVSDEPIPFFLGVLDDLVQLGGDDDGEPKALLETDAEAVRAWAHETIDAYRNASRRHSGSGP